MRLIQIQNGAGVRRVALTEDAKLRLLSGASSIYEIAQQAMNSGDSLRSVVEGSISAESLDYDPVYDGASDWRILPAIDHPADPARCLVSGTGLTHLQSAKNRNAMHAGAAETIPAPTDSMRMYQWGVEGGRPAEGKIGTAPEWFYKGNASVLRAHGQPLDIPPHAEDGGEEPEIAGVYVIDAQGSPRRIGMAQGNEFSDHRFEKRNYLYLASSKLMTCAIGPELAIGADFTSVPGEVSIERAGSKLWSKAISSGDSAMSHSLANMEHHHFKHAGHRRPGDIHVHFFGADAFSFGEGLTLENGDVMVVHFDNFGRPLRNPVQIQREPQRLFAAQAL